MATGNAGKGRPKGSRNKLTRQVREAVLTALHEAGGVDYLRWAAREQPAAFMALLGKLLAAEMRAAPVPELPPLRVVFVPPGEPGGPAGEL